MGQIKDMDANTARQIADAAQRRAEIMWEDAYRGVAHRAARTCGQGAAVSLAQTAFLLRAGMTFGDLAGDILDATTTRAIAHLVTFTPPRAEWRNKRLSGLDKSGEFCVLHLPQVAAYVEPDPTQEGV